MQAEPYSGLFQKENSAGPCSEWGAMPAGQQMAAPEAERQALAGIAYMLHTDQKAVEGCLTTKDVDTRHHK